MQAPKAIRSLALVALLVAPATAQEASDATPRRPAEVERIYVPSKGFQKVLRRHPRGALITEAELQKLLTLAGQRRPTVLRTAPPAPMPATIQRLTVSGKIEQGVAVLTADAVVSVLAPGQVGLPLPLAQIGLRGVWVDGKPARVIVTSRGPEVLLPVEATARGPVARRVTWEFALSVSPGEGRGAGVLGIPVPAAASGRLELDLPGDLEVRPTTATLRRRGDVVPADKTVVWAESRAAGRTIARGAFGGGSSTTDQAVCIAWRPRRAIERVTPYVVGTAQTRFEVQRGIVALRSAVRLDVHRGARDAFTFDLPAGFVVTSLALRQGAVTHVQRGDRVTVRLDAPRRGTLQFDLACELSLGSKRAQAQTLALRPIGLPDVDRVDGALGVARGPHTKLQFGAVQGLYRADLSALTMPGTLPRATLVRVYRRSQPTAQLTLTTAPLEPQVRLVLNTTVQVREREVRAVALYRFRVEQGSVFTLRATLPPGYQLEDTLLTRGARRLPHQLKVRDTKGGTELLVELARGLTRGEQVLFAVEAVSEQSGGVAGAELELPRFGGSPASTVSGHIGLAPDGAFRLRGSKLSGVTAIPAQELRRRGGRGIEWSNIVLAYRLEQPSYGGTVAVTRKDSRLAAEVLAHHVVGEQTVATDAVLDLEVRGAPRSSVVLLFPPGVGKLARIEGPGTRPDRESLGTNDDGWERFRIGFAKPVTGKLRLRVRFETKLETASESVTHRLPKVSVEGAVRERGSLAVFSSGATELQETTEGLRPLDVTEFPAHPFRTQEQERPLLAYTHVSDDYALTLAVTRHARAAVLSAVAETLSLKTSVGPDGTARHTARFRVKNVANQYFALKLPEEAVLWSVVVNGQGVKPAGEGGERIIPIPSAGSDRPNQLTEVVATYTSKGSRWGTFGVSDLVAPELRFGQTSRSVTDAVPVLKTTWALALPDEYRVLEFAGNVDGQAVPGVSALAIAGWRGAKQGPWAWLALIGLFGLAVGASRTIRRGLLVGLVGASTVARNTRDNAADAARAARAGAADAATSPAARKGVGLVVAVLILIGLCTVVFKTLGGRRGAPDMQMLASDRQYKAAKTAKSDMRPRDRGPAGAAGSIDEVEFEDAEEADRRPPSTKEVDSLRALRETARTNTARLKGDAAKDGKKAKLKKRRPRRQSNHDAKERQDRGRRAAKTPRPGEMPPPAPQPAKPSAPKAEEPQDPRRSESRNRDKAGKAGEGGEEEKPMAFDDHDDDAPEPSLDSPKNAFGGRGSKKNSKQRPAPKKAEAQKKADDQLAKQPGVDAPTSGDDGGLGLVTEGNELSTPRAVVLEKAKFGTLGGFGQVGLRSLVLDLASVGKQAQFKRAGGNALVSVQFVKEAVLVTIGGLLALLGFVLGLFLPRTGRLTAAGLLTLALVAVTAIPVLWPGSALTALLNALALGLLLSAPALGVIAVARWWGTAPLSRLAEAMAQVRREQEGAASDATSGPSPATAAAVVLLLLLVGAPSAARADGKGPEEEPLRVYVPYDTDQTDRSGKPLSKGTVFLPQKVFEELKRRAGKGPQTAGPVAPPAPHIITAVDYQGRLGASGLTLSATVKVDILAKGWQRAHLGLAGTGLKRATIEGVGKEQARVKVAPAGGFELVARGPASYTVTLDLIVPRRAGYTFATVPCLAAQMTIATDDLGDRRLVVDGAAAQLERPFQGKQTVFASLGDAPRVSLLLRSRAVLSSGASEASAQTRSVVSVKPGRLELHSQTQFVISGAGREGFVFTLPQGFETTFVGVVDPTTRRTLPMRAWSTAGDKLEITLRKPTGARAVVVVRGELKVAAAATSLVAPQLVAQGVTRETGQIGLASGTWLKVRPGKVRGLRQIPARSFSDMTSALKLNEVQWGYRFARRPAELPIELIQEQVELQASGKVSAVIKKDRYLVSADFVFQVRRGQVYELRLAVPAGLELVRPLRGELKVSEVNHRKGPEGWRIYTLGLQSALSSTAELGVDFEQRLVPAEVASGTTLPFPEVRPLDVSREQSAIGLATADNLELRVPNDPAGLVLRDVNEVTRGWNAPSNRAKWQLGYTRPSRQGELTAPAQVRVKRPTPYVEGSWVLHARVERDVVRYTLRALYQIGRAGVDTFHLQVPQGIERQARVEAQNRREVSITPDGDGLRYTVHLQSPVETFYALSISWEALLGSERSFTIPAVNVTGIDRAVRGFVLVEKAPEVADLLEQTEMSGVARKGRAGDAPALPPGKGAQDFVLAYQVPLNKGADWGVTCQLKRRNVQHPPAARIPWAHITSVFTRDGKVRHLARYRVRNLRLQFLELALPEKAEVWSVFVAKRPRRLHHKDGHALIPLPKRSAADLPIDVEVIYTTSLSGSLGFGSLKVHAPVLKTPDIQVEKTFWTAYLPEDYEYRGFGGNVSPTTQLEVAVTTLVEEVQEQARLEEVARSGAGNKRSVADGNLEAQVARVQEQLKACLTIDTKNVPAKEQKKVQELLNVLKKQDQVAKQVRQASQQRRQAYQAEQQQQQAQNKLGQVQQLGGNRFVQLDTNTWRRNTTFFKKGNKERWANVGRARGDGQIVLALPQDARLSLRNMELFDRSRRRILNNRNYTSGQAEARRAGQATGKYWRAKQRQEERDRPRADGLLSIQVDFPTPGKAYHFVTDTTEAPTLEVSSYPTETASVAQRLAQALCLLALLAGILRLGLHLPVAGKGALQTLLLIAAAALAAFSLASLVGAAITFLLSLAAIHRGRLWPSLAEAAPAATGAVA